MLFLIKIVYFHSKFRPQKCFFGYFESENPVESAKSVPLVINLTVLYQIV